MNVYVYSAVYEHNEDLICLSLQKSQLVMRQHLRLSLTFNEVFLKYCYGCTRNDMKLIINIRIGHDIRTNYHI